VFGGFILAERGIESNTTFGRIMVCRYAVELLNLAGCDLATTIFLSENS
jgi:hypothetical protein